MPDQSLGTISATVRLILTQLEQDSAKAKATLASLGQSISDTMEKQAKVSAESFAKIGQVAQQAGRELEIAGAAILGGLGVAVKVGSDWQEQLIHISANTGMTKQETEDMRKVIEQTAASTAAPLSKIADGYMKIHNFGFNAADATKILTAATRAAVATGADATKTSELLAGTMLNFGISADKAAESMNKMIVASSRANSTLQEFVASAGHAYAVGHTMGLGLDDINAVLITATQHQYDMALAVTQTVGIMHQLTRPTTDAKNTIESLGAAGKQLQKDLSFQGISRGLVNIAADIVKAADATHRDAAEIASHLALGQRGGDLLKVLVTNLKQLQDNYKQGEAQTWQFVAANTTLAAKIEILKNNFQVMAAGIATALTPTINELLSDMQAAVKWFESLATPQKEAIVQFAAIAGAALLAGGALLSVAGSMASFAASMVIAWPAITAATGAASVAIGAALAPFTGWLVAIGAAVALLAVAWAQNWYHTREMTTEFVEWVKPYLSQFWTEIVETAKSSMGELQRFWHELFPPMEADTRGFVGDTKHDLSLLGTIFGQIWNTIVLVVQEAWNLLKGIIQTGATIIEGIIATGLKVIQGDWQGAWDTMSSYVSKTFESILGTVANAMNLIRAYIDEVRGVESTWQTAHLGFEPQGHSHGRLHTSAELTGQVNTQQKEYARTHPSFGGGGGGGGKGGGGAMDALKEKALEARRALNEVYESLYKLSHDDFANQRHDALREFMELRARGVNEIANAELYAAKLMKIQHDEEESHYQKMNALRKRAQDIAFAILEPGRKLAEQAKAARDAAEQYAAELWDGVRAWVKMTEVINGELLSKKADSALSNLLGGEDLGAMTRKLGEFFSKTVEAAKKAKEEIEAQAEGAEHAFWQAFDKQREQMEENASRMKKTWSRLTKSMADQMVNVFEGAFTDLFEHGWKSFFSDILKGFEKMLEQMVAQLLAKAVIFGFLSLFGGGIQGHKSFFNFLGFDNWGNDRQAQHWGFDYADHFTRGIKEFASRAQPAGGKSGAQTIVHAPVTLHAVINHEMDIKTVADRLAWHMQTRGVNFQGTG